MVFKNLCFLVLWTNVASALEGLRLCLPSVHQETISAAAPIGWLLTLVLYWVPDVAGSLSRPSAICWISYSPIGWQLTLVLYWAPAVAGFVCRHPAICWISYSPIGWLLTQVLSWAPAVAGFLCRHPAICWISYSASFAIHHSIIPTLIYIGYHYHWDVWLWYQNVYFVWFTCPGMIHYCSKWAVRLHACCYPGWRWCHCEICATYYQLIHVERLAKKAAWCHSCFSFSHILSWQNSVNILY